jgi:hypothetical protein
MQKLEEKSLLQSLRLMALQKRLLQILSAGKRKEKVFESRFLPTHSRYLISIL